MTKKILQLIICINNNKNILKMSKKSNKKITFAKNNFLVFIGMRKYIFGLTISLIIIVGNGCSKDFRTWQELNDDFMNNNKKELQEKYKTLFFDEKNDTLKTGESGITASGVQYEIFHRGFGAVAKRSSYVYLKMEIRLIDGTRATYSEYTEFLVGSSSDNCPEGIAELLCQLPKSSYFKAYVPYDKGFGEDGLGKVVNIAGGYRIPPYSALICEVEIIEITQNPPSAS
jgi:FKBP-type peptidyl-prolyl cis-trans isomerase